MKYLLLLFFISCYEKPRERVTLGTTKFPKSSPTENISSTSKDPCSFSSFSLGPISLQFCGLNSQLLIKNNNSLNQNVCFYPMGNTSSGGVLIGTGKCLNLNKKGIFKAELSANRSGFTQFSVSYAMAILEAHYGNTPLRQNTTTTQAFLDCMQILYENGDNTLCDQVKNKASYKKLYF